MQKGHYCEIAYLKTGVLRRSDLISVVLFEVLSYSYLITWQDMEADNSINQSEKNIKLSIYITGESISWYMIHYYLVTC